MRVLVWAVAMVTAAGVLQVRNQPAPHTDTPTLGWHGKNDGNHGVQISGRGIEFTHMQLMRGIQDRAPVTVKQQEWRAEGNPLLGREIEMLNLTVGRQSFGDDVAKPDAPTQFKARISFRF